MVRLLSWQRQWQWCGLWEAPLQDTATEKLMKNDWKSQLIEVSHGQTEEFVAGRMTSEGLMAWSRKSRVTSEGLVAWSRKSAVTSEGLVAWSRKSAVTSEGLIKWNNGCKTNDELSYLLFLSLVSVLFWSCVVCGPICSANVAGMLSSMLSVNELPVPCGLVLISNAGFVCVCVWRACFLHLQ